jgi:hypothetical protein
MNTDPRIGQAEADPPREEDPPSHATVTEGQSGSARLQIEALLPWDLALEVLRILAESKPEWADFQHLGDPAPR